MLSTKHLLSDIRDISSAWVFSYYCNVPLDEFNGAEFKIHSVFNTEKTPSMAFYVKDDKYRFNDFSSGNRGDHIDLVMAHKGLTYAEACDKILKDYNRWALTSGESCDLRSINAQAKYRVSQVEKRKWNTDDRNYWTAYNIGSKLLSRFNVFPLYSYTMTREGREVRILGNHIYGYFKLDGSLYKIYQPFNGEHKFLKIKDYVQGSEQVLGRPFMGYLSSLKDVMAFESLEINADVKAPDSENTLIPDRIIKDDQGNYKALFLLFDIDENGAGQKAAKRYEQLYSIPPVHLVMGEKDLSDSIKRFGPKKVRERLIPLIDKALNR